MVTCTLVEVYPCSRITCPSISREPGKQAVSFAEASAFFGGLVFNTEYGGSTFPLHSFQSYFEETVYTYNRDASQRQFYSTEMVLHDLLKS
jgi:hypothetical protein